MTKVAEGRKVLRKQTAGNKCVRLGKSRIDRKRVKIYLNHQL